MIRLALLVGLAALMASSPARAAVPEFVLDKDYQSCIADGKDAQRNDYCACVRDGMRDWSEGDYAEIAQQTAAASSPAQAPARLDALARQCIARVLH